MRNQVGFCGCGQTDGCDDGEKRFEHARTVRMATTGRQADRLKSLRSAFSRTTGPQPDDSFEVNVSDLEPLTTTIIGFSITVVE
jgi:hypothetical protein